MNSVRVLLRNRSEVLLHHSGDDTDSPRWGAVSGPADTDPEREARRAVLTGTDLSPADITLAAAGEPFRVDLRSGQRWVHPFVFDCERREVTLDGNGEWVPPTAILSRETVPGLWETYDRVRPSVETVADDTEHGSTEVSIRALEMLRDEAGLAAHGQQSDAGASDDRPVAAVARELVTARPSMTAVGNRVHRAMAAADEPPAVVSTAHEGIKRARRADSEAARAGTDLLGTRVATLSRSGTVREALERADPAEILVAESRPGGEGRDVATALAAGGGPVVTLTTDAAFEAELATREIDTLVVGADAVLADGRVVNKAGTRAAALAAAHEGIPVVVATASDKIAPGIEHNTEERDPTEVYNGDTPVSVANPIFDVTPASAIDTVATERGTLDTDGVAAIAAEHDDLREWENP